jgi:hypothetical protein
MSVYFKKKNREKICLRSWSLWLFFFNGTSTRLFFFDGTPTTLFFLTEDSHNGTDMEISEPVQRKNKLGQHADVFQIERCSIN